MFIKKFTQEFKLKTTFWNMLTKFLRKSGKAFKLRKNLIKNSPSDVRGASQTVLWLI